MRNPAAQCKKKSQTHSRQRTFSSLRNNDDTQHCCVYCKGFKKVRISRDFFFLFLFSLLFFSFSFLFLSFNINIETNPKTFEKHIKKTHPKKPKRTLFVCQLGHSLETRIYFPDLLFHFIYTIYVFRASPYAHSVSSSLKYYLVTAFPLALLYCFISTLQCKNSF